MSLEHPDSAAVLKDLLNVMDLRQTATGPGVTTFEGARYTKFPSRRVFGGQVLGQSMMAASLTVAPDRPVHSMHGYFLRGGDPRETITFEVEHLRDGRSFSARRVLAMQHGRPIAGMSASFQLEQEGGEHSLQMPAVPDPETLPSTADLLGQIDNPLASYFSHERPFDVRHVSVPIYLAPDPDRNETMYVWMKAVAPVPDVPLLHRALLAYASDYTMIEPVLRRQGLAWVSGQDMASLDHSMWWYRPVRVDEWLLYRLTSPSSQGGRGLGIGSIFTRDGVLVASVAQEVMVRPPHA